MDVTDFQKKLEKAKRASTAQLLFKCARIVNERAIAGVELPSGERPRTSHMALFPHIELEGGTRVTDLANKVGITKQAVGQLVDDLQRFGVVERVPDPDDRRAKRVCFTEAGRASMLQGLKHLREIERELGRAIGRKTMTALHDALLVLNDHLDQLESTDEAHSD
ncbi:MAG: winged helix-turn-helix transcriptional regulator [Nannocystaceae bacterium]|nr:winged helix-turn-helix transcriptional regulator [Nannocystaceae bacterium]